jgi:hypothetical protein
MFSHGIATLSLICILMLGLIGTASAHDGYTSVYDGHLGGDRDGSGYCGWSDGGWNDCGGRKAFGSDPSAPELDPALLGSGVAILSGGIILLNERRRNRK